MENQFSVVYFLLFSQKKFLKRRNFFRRSFENVGHYDTEKQKTFSRYRRQTKKSSHFLATATNRFNFFDVYRRRTKKKFRIFSRHHREKTSAYSFRRLTRSNKCSASFISIISTREMSDILCFDSFV